MAAASPLYCILPTRVGCNPILRLTPNLITRVRVVARERDRLGLDPRGALARVDEVLLPCALRHQARPTRRLRHCDGRAVRRRPSRRPRRGWGLRRRPLVCLPAGCGAGGWLAGRARGLRGRVVGPCGDRRPGRGGCWAADGYRGQGDGGLGHGECAPGSAGQQLAAREAGGSNHAHIKQEETTRKMEERIFTARSSYGLLELGS